MHALTLIDTPALVVFNIILASAMGVVLLVTRLGLDTAAVRLDTWLIGASLLILSRLMTPLEEVFAFLGLHLPGMTLMLPLMLCGLYWQAMGLRGLRGREVRRSHLLRHSLLAGITVVALDTVLDITVFLYIFLAGLLLVGMLLLREALMLARRTWGGRLLAATAGLMLISNLLLLDTSAASSEQVARRGLLVEMLWALFSTAGFLQCLYQDLREKLAATAMTDALTGALNRHGLLPQLERELARARRGQPLSVVLCDLDHFKKINDQHGHDVGDTVLKRFVARARAGLRRSDLLGRWGGEEFLFVLPDTAAAEAVRVAERVRANLLADSAAPPIRFSAGVASTTEPALQCDLQRLLSCADHRLYIAKQQRDRVVGNDADALDRHVG
ncbi:GGDEF domain-containing protein [Azohydromonas lata]|uniref:diguanylate cyclase n=1 Tax=Azohydromonas lata TaxID=45677 RepID=A0ABU5I7S6_9BURK|nr:GGDEF domain-containing protein [Azohydromonas lata]MDZ5455161.1 GGDEF domain-containing protein [Azohydromonas lata]